MIPKARLGKRSPLGALVCSSCPATMDASLDPESLGDQDGGMAAAAMIPGPGPQAHHGRVKLHPGQKVYLQCGGRECSGLVEQHNHVDNQVSVFLHALGRHVLRKTEDVWTSPSAPPLSPSSPTTPSSSSSVIQTPGKTHTISSCIDVPGSQKSPEAVEMDEMMAALVLTSLSCSPLLHSPPHRDAPAAPGMECAGGELSDSGSSGYWSVGGGNGSPVPSPPITEPDGSVATPSDEGLDMELEQVLFDEPAPRKRRNSVKVAYRCLWPSCGKVLTSVVGIKRHIRTLHLGQNGEHERCSRSEEDFYYTEIHQRDQQALTPPPTPLLPAFSPWPGSPASSPASPLTPAACAPPLGTTESSNMDGVGPGQSSLPTDTESLHSSLLSQSAPSGSFWQVQSEHSYQALPVSPVASVLVASPAVSSAPPPTCHWTTTPSASHSKQGAPFRVRSVSVGEQWLQQHSAPMRPHPASTSPPRGHWTARRVRGEAKKCRKVYGIEHRDQWCTACRWKKACQRFLD